MAETCVVNQAVRDALRDSEAAYAERGILVVPSLEAGPGLRNHDRVLYHAVYTIFRGLPYRIAPGSTLFISTVDKTGGDVELTWEAREEPGGQAHPAGAPGPGEALSSGPYGDLLEIAILGLDALCRARGALMERQEAARGPVVTGLDLSPKVRRRFSFLIPSLQRGPDWLA